MGLRAEISRCTQKTDPADHPRLIHELSLRHAHTIEPLEQGDDRVSCFMHALGIQPFDEVMYYARHPDLGLPEDCLGDFAAYLVECGATEAIDDAELLPGGVALYSRHSKTLHAGRVITRQRVESKWGKGWIWQHGLWEIPVTYGNRVLYARPVPDDRLLPAFILFIWQTAADVELLPAWFVAEAELVARKLGILPEPHR